MTEKPYEVKLSFCGKQDREKFRVAKCHTAMRPLDVPACDRLPPHDERFGHPYLSWGDLEFGYSTENSGLRLAFALASDLLGGNVELAADLAPHFYHIVVSRLPQEWWKPASELAKALLECIHVLTVKKVAQFRARAAGGESVQAELAAFRAQEVEAIFRLSEHIVPLDASAYVHAKDRDDEAEEVVW